MRKLRILHLTGDYPDPVRQPTTKAIKNTIDRLPQFEHLVISMDRTANPMKSHWTDCGTIGAAHVIAHGQWGLPFGIGLYTSFYLTAWRIYQKLKTANWRPDIIHAHRLTFDGIAARLLAHWWDVPFVVSVRGEVESKVFRFKPLYRRLMRRIIEEAKAVYYVSLWYRRDLRHYTGITADKERSLPNIVLNTSPKIKPVKATKGFVSIFNFAIYKKKGLTRLLPAFKQALLENQDMTLDLIGPGSADDHEVVSRLVARHNLEDHVTIIGQIEHSDLVERLSSYRALVLPSHNETFGMVYTEALFAGVPVLYSAQTGIDGYLDAVDVGVRVDPKNIAEIASGLSRLWRDHERFRQTVYDNATTLFDRFDPENHLQIYDRDMRQFAAHH